MTEETLTLGRARELIVLAAGQATAGAFQLLEHYRETAELPQDCTEIPGLGDSTPELLAEALALALDVDLAIHDEMISNALTDMAEKQLGEARANISQLRGAITRYIEGWAP